MKKLVLALLWFFTLTVKAQTGSFKVITPVTEISQGEFVWNITWEKIATPSQGGFKFSYNITPGNAFRTGSATFTRSQTGFTNQDITVTGGPCLFSFDVYLNGGKIGRWEESSANYMQGTPTGWVSVAGAYKNFVSGATEEAAKNTFAGNVEVRNFAFKQHTCPLFSLSENLLAKLKQPANNTASGNTGNSNSGVAGNTMGNSASGGAKSGQQVYTQTVERNKTIADNSAKANEQVTVIANAIGDAVNANRKREIEQAGIEMERKQQAWERQVDADFNAQAMDNEARQREYDKTWVAGLKKQYAALEANPQEYADWLTTCRGDGSKQALMNFAAKHNTNMGFQAELSAELWDNPAKATNSDLYITAVTGNWNLVKFLLNKGVRADFVYVDPFGNYYSTIQLLFAPLYKTGQALKYMHPDRDDLFRKLVENGADPNGPLKQNIYAGKVVGYNYLFSLIMENDYYGNNMDWLLKNNKLTALTKQNAITSLVYYKGDGCYRGWQKTFESVCSIYSPTLPKENALDLFFIHLALLVKYGAPVAGTFPFSERTTHNVTLSAPPPNRWADKTNYNFLDIIWVDAGNINTYINFQAEMLARVNEVDRAYFANVAHSCIVNHGTHTDAHGNKFDFKPLLQLMIQKGISPRAKEIYIDGNTYSMITLAQAKNPALVDFLKSCK